MARSPARSPADFAKPVVPEADPVLQAGATLGTWCVVKLLGEGGMGRVYLAEHSAIGRRVALKVLKRALARSPELVERFFAEAHAVNRIRHPGIVEVTDCFVDDGGTPCLVMELLEGRTLAQEMAATRIHPSRVAAIGADVATALDAAHKAGVIHRDMKPDNLFLVDKDGKITVKVLDFGVAKLMDPMPNSTVHTVAGSIMGTPDYMAPEQLAGKPVDARADIYALGASLYHAATSRPPFQASNFGDLVVMHMTKPPPPPSRFANIPPVLEQVLLAMLEKDPARRPQTMGDVALLLRSAQKIGGALATLEPANDRALPARNPTASFVVAATDFVGKSVGPVGPPPPLPPPRGMSPSQAPLALLPPPPGWKAVGSANANPPDNRPGFAGAGIPALREHNDSLDVVVGYFPPLNAHTPSGTLLLGSADAPEVRDDVAGEAPISAWIASRFYAAHPPPRAAPPWAWAAVAGLLFVAIGGGAWAVAADRLREPAIVAVTAGYQPMTVATAATVAKETAASARAQRTAPDDLAPATPSALAAELLAPTLTSALPMSTRLDADSVTTRSDATTLSVAASSVAPVVAKSGKAVMRAKPSKGVKLAKVIHDGKRAKGTAAPKAKSTALARRAVLDPFAKESR